jgi:DNA-binding MarR family transcriptional regulator
MRNIPRTVDLDADVARLRGILVAVGRLHPLRDPIATFCEDTDLTPVQLHAVVWLNTEGALTMGDLARRVGVADKTITGVADRLEEAGLLVRERDEADRRVVRGRLTRKGAAIAARINARLDEGMRHVLALLDDTGREALFRILDRLAERVGAGDGGART